VQILLSGKGLIIRGGLGPTIRDDDALEAADKCTCLVMTDSKIERVSNI
jgi:hypothetical protein